MVEVYFNQYGYYGEAYIAEYYKSVLWYPSMSECEQLVKTKFEGLNCVVIRDKQIADFLALYVPVSIIPIKLRILFQKFIPHSNLTFADDLLPLLSSEKREQFLPLYVFAKLHEQGVTLNPSYFYADAPFFYFGSVKTPYPIVEKCKELDNANAFITELLYEIVTQKTGEYTKVAEWLGDPNALMPEISDEMRNHLLQWGLIVEVQKGKFEVLR
jgi:hypothetical protein